MRLASEPWPCIVYSGALFCIPHCLFQSSESWRVRDCIFVGRVVVPHPVALFADRHLRLIARPVARLVFLPDRPNRAGGLKLDFMALRSGGPSGR
jgi:hypothetical protein